MRTRTSRRLLVAVVVLIVLGGAFQSAWADPQANKEASRRVNQEAWSQGQLAVVDEVVAPDYVYHEPALGDVRGPEGLKQTILGYRTAYPDLQFTIDDIIAQGDLVALRWTATGTHEAELMGIPATGLSTTTTGINIMRFNDDGMVVEEWSTWDVLGLLQQLGAVPADREEYVWGEPTSITGDPGNPQANTVKVISYTEEVWNYKRVTQLEATNSPDILVHNPMLLGQPLDIDRYRDATEGFIANMPDLNVEFHHLIAEGDIVAGHYTTSGTHLPSGKKIAFDGVTWYRFADDKIVETWWMYDAYGMMQQIMAPAEYSPDGQWICAAPTPLGSLIITGYWEAANEDGSQLIGQWKQINGFPLLTDLYPEIDVTEFAGEQAVKIAPNTYAMSMNIYYAKKPGPNVTEIVGIGLMSATFEVLGPDAIQGQGTVAYYLASQDADQDGFPDEGEEAQLCIPWGWTCKRPVMAPGCVPAPTE